MVLQFRPPEDLINAYLNRPSAGQIASSGIQQALQTYVQNKLQQQQLASLEGQRKAGEFKAIADYIPEAQIPSVAKNYGINIPSFTPPTPSTGTAPSPTAGLPDASGAPVTSAPPSIVQAHVDAGFNPLNLPTSRAGLAKYKSGLETQKLQKDLEKPEKGPLKTVTKEQTLAEGTFDPTKQIMVEPPASRLDIGIKESQQQDKLEEQYRKSFQQIRGDPALKRTEEQRDAAAVVYNRIKDVKAQGQILNPIDYIDSLGQIYKARTGTAPTETVLKEARQATAKGQFGKAFTYLTGQQAPATTEDIMNSLQDMALHMGEQADKFHDGYMRSRMRPPKGLAHDRVENIHAERGMSFAEATDQMPKASKKSFLKPGEEAEYEAYRKSMKDQR